MRPMLVLALALVGCSKTDPPQKATAPAAPDPVPSVAVSVTPPQPTSFTETRSVARFTGGDLDECVDFTMTANRAFDAGALNAIHTSAKKDGDTPIPKLCAEQFPARVALSTCDKSQTGDGGVFSLRQYKYRFTDVGLSDKAMKECLEEAGNWHELDRNSPQWRQAKLEHSRKNLERAAGKLQEAAEQPSD